MAPFVKKLTAFISAAIVLSPNSYSQVVCYTVADFDTKQPLSYAYVKWGNVMYLSDTAGKFCITPYERSLAENARSLVVTSLIHFQTEVDLTNGLDTIFLVKQKLKIPKGTKCLTQCKVRKSCYRRKEISTGGYTLVFRKQEIRYDTTYKSKDQFTITNMRKNERYVQTRR